MKRQFWVLFHRYAGLTMAFFLIVAGLTGACLAFYKPINRWLAPQRYDAPARGTVLDPFVLLEKAQTQMPGWRTDMLRHVPSPDLQDWLLAEIARVLKPGGVLFGADSLDSPGFREFHLDDVCVPIDPLTFPERLRRAGFAEVNVQTGKNSVCFTASRL